MKRLIFYPLLITLLAHGLVHAQDTLSIHSFDQMWAMAQSRNPTLEVYQLHVQQATERHKASKSFLLPTIGVGMSYQDNLVLPTVAIDGNMLGRQGDMMYLQFGKQYHYSGGLSLSYTLFDWQKIVAMQSASNQVELQKAQSEHYVQNLKNQTAWLYCQTLVAQRSLALSKEDLRVARENLQIAQSKFDAEASSITSLNQARINYHNVERNAIASQQLLSSNMYEIRILLGLGMADSLLVQGGLPEQLLDNTREHTLREDKRLATYDWLVKDAAYRLKSEKVAKSFKLSLNAYVGVDQFNDNFGLTFHSADWFQQQYVGLTLTRPLFTGFNSYNRIREAKTSLHVQQLQASTAKQQAQVADRRIVSEVEQAAQSANSTYMSYQLCKDNLEIYQARYNEGVIGLDAYLQYFDNYLKAENLYLSELSSYYSKLSIVISRN